MPITPVEITLCLGVLVVCFRGWGLLPPARLPSNDGPKKRRAGKPTPQDKPLALTLVPALRCGTGLGFLGRGLSEELRELQPGQFG